MKELADILISNQLTAGTRGLASSFFAIANQDPQQSFSSILNQLQSNLGGAQKQMSNNASNTIPDATANSTAPVVTDGNHSDTTTLSSDGLSIILSQLNSLTMNMGTSQAGSTNEGAATDGLSVLQSLITDIRSMSPKQAVEFLNNLTNGKVDQSELKQFVQIIDSFERPGSNNTGSVTDDNSLVSNRASKSDEDSTVFVGVIPSNFSPSSIINNLSETDQTSENPTPSIVNESMPDGDYLSDDILSNSDFINAAKFLDLKMSVDSNGTTLTRSSTNNIDPTLKRIVGALFESRAGQVVLNVLTQNPKQLSGNGAQALNESSIANLASPALNGISEISQDSGDASAQDFPENTEMPALASFSETSDKTNSKFQFVSDVQNSKIIPSLSSSQMFGQTSSSLRTLLDSQDSKTISPIVETKETMSISNAKTMDLLKPNISSLGLPTLLDLGSTILNIKPTISNGTESTFAPVSIEDDSMRQKIQTLGAQSINALRASENSNEGSVIFSPISKPDLVNILNGEDVGRTVRSNVPNFQSSQLSTMQDVLKSGLGFDNLDSNSKNMQSSVIGFIQPAPSATGSGKGSRTLSYGTTKNDQTISLPSSVPSNGTLQSVTGQVLNKGVSPYATSEPVSNSLNLNHDQPKETGGFKSTYETAPSDTNEPGIASLYDNSLPSVEEGNGFSGQILDQNDPNNTALANGLSQEENLNSFPNESPASLPKVSGSTVTAQVAVSSAQVSDNYNPAMNTQSSLNQTQAHVPDFLANPNNISFSLSNVPMAPTVVDGQPLQSSATTSGPLNQTTTNAVLTQISQQVQNHISTGNQVSHLSFQLIPQSLGRVSVQIVLVDQAISARILVTTPMVKEAIQHHMVELKSSLNQAGLQIDHLEVNIRDGYSNTWAQYYQYQQDQNSGRYLPIELFKTGNAGNFDDSNDLATISTQKMSLVDLLA